MGQRHAGENVVTAHYFPPRSEMQADLAPVVVDAAEQLGSRSDIYELTPVRQPDGTTKRVPNLLLKNDVAVKFKQMTSEEALTIFGLNPNVTMKGKLSRVTPVALDNVFDVTSGGFSARRFQVKSVIERDLSDSYLLGLIDYEGAV